MSAPEPVEPVEPAEPAPGGAPDAAEPPPRAAEPGAAPGDAAEPLSAELEAALVRELRATFESENRERFRGALRPPVLALADRSSRLGAWIRATRTLELSRALVLERSWPEVVAVLLHEMAHQYVDEVLRIGDESAHGDTFRRVCAERGIDARAAGSPVPAADTSAGDRVLDRIRKLLALAGSANQHEAELAMRKAHELMLRHNVEVSAAAPARAFEVRCLGEPLQRGTRVEADVASLLGRFFFVRVIRIPVYVPRAGRRGLVYEISGTRANVELAAHVYAFLLATSERLWRANRGDSRVRNGRDRLAYQSGVIRGFAEKLDAERVELRGTGLVWAGDRLLDEHFRARHPNIVTRRRRVRVNSAHAAGKEAGRTVVLHRPVEQGAQGARKLLGP
jgi:hypothetical protein